MTLANLVDALLGDARGPDGRPLLEIFLDDPASASLHPAAREYAAAWAAAPLSLYEVEEVAVGEGMVVNDLLRRRRLTVKEKSATESLDRWDVLFARVAEMEGANLLTGGLYPIRRRDLDWVLEQIRGLKGLPGSHSLTWTRFLKRDWSLVPELWFHLNVASRSQLELTNTDGDPLVQIGLEIEVRDPDGLRLRLDETPGIEPTEPDSWIWQDDRPDRPLERVTLAFLEINVDTLRVSVNSLQRETRIIELLQSRAKDCLGRVSRRETPIDLESTRDSELPADSPPEPVVPPEIERQIVHQHLEDHYRRWPDMKLLALDDHTPREAAHDRALRPRLVSLLKEMELNQSRASEPTASFDLSFLWAELGLKRP